MSIKTKTYKKALELICTSWLKTQGPQPCAETVEEMAEYFIRKADLELNLKEVRVK